MRPAPRPRKSCWRARIVGDGLRQTDLSVPDMHCGGCLHKIETALGRLDGVSARPRQSLDAPRQRALARRSAAAADRDARRRSAIAAHLFDAADERDDPVLSNCCRALAVAGFAASNIMLLSVVGLVGRRRRDARPLPLDFGADRAAGAGLFRAGVLPLGLARAAPRPAPTWTCRSRSACCSPSA